MSRWLSRTNDGSLCTSKFNLARLHSTPCSTGTTGCLFKGCLEIQAIVMMMQQKQMKNAKHFAPSLFSCAEAAVAHMTEWFEAPTISPDTQPAHILNLYCTASHKPRGVYFYSWNSRDPSVFTVLEMHSPRKSPTRDKQTPHETSTIHWNLHGYVWCGQDSLSVQR